MSGDPIEAAGQKWAEYRRIRDAIFSACWDCHRPCADCRDWARAKAFGREWTGDPWFGEACAEVERQGGEKEG